MDYVLYRLDNGEIVRQFTCDEDTAHEQAGPNQGVIPGTGSWVTHRVVNGEVVRLAQPRTSPHEGASWNPATASWFDPRDLSKVKFDKWEEIKKAREEAISAPITTPYGIFDADELSRSNLIQALQFAQVSKSAGQNDSVEFTLANNSTVTLNTDKLAEIWVLVGKRMQQQRNKAASIRSQIQLASTVSQVKAISWT